MSKQNGHTAPPEARAGLAEALRVLDEVMPAPEGDEGGQKVKGRPSDGQLAQRWCDENPDCRYGLGAMRRYRDGHWPVIDAEVFMQSVLDMLTEAEPEGVRVTQRLLTSVAYLIKTKCTVPAGSWDSDPNIIVCTNGTIDLRTMTLREHRADDYVTTSLDYAYDAAAVCPTFERVLSESLPHDAIEFLQEFAGYALTTDTRHEIAVWLYGPPGSGKSTITEAMEVILGPRAGTLSLAEIEQSRFALGGIAGKTLLLAAEQPAGYMRAAYRLNALISGESLSVERKFVDAVTIRPVCKILWAMNDLPRTEASSGLFRRVRVIPCRPVEQPDPAVKAMVRGERAGILNFALRGLQRLRERGCFDVPASVQEASKHFQRASDIPAQFLEERCERGEGYRVSGSELYRVYREWCEMNGHQPMSSTTIAEHWARLGLVRYRANGATYYRGVRFLSHNPAGGGI